MKIEIKSIKHYSGLSEETNAFSAKLYINGVHAGECNNSGTGGCTNVHPNSCETVSLINEARNFCKDELKLEFEPLESFIDDLVNADLLKKESAKCINKIKKLLGQYPFFAIEEAAFVSIKQGTPIGFRYAAGNRPFALKDGFVWLNSSML